jgi:hypothetical protein
LRHGRDARDDRVMAFMLQAIPHCRSPAANGFRACMYLRCIN